MDWRVRELRAGEFELRRAGRQKAPLTIGFAALLLALASHLGHARDLDGRYANSPLKQWFGPVFRSGKGPCCSDADGSALAMSIGNRKADTIAAARGRMDRCARRKAVITEPNRVGRTMVCRCAVISG